MSKLPFTLTTLMTPSAVVPAGPEAIAVHQLVEQVRQSVERGFGTVSVIGEVSSFKPWRSGHWYFDLKDEKALLPAVMFRQNCERVSFELKDGMKVIATARVSVYAPQSKIQLIVQSLEPAGVGALALQFEQLKHKLETEGLFNPARKKLLPIFPKCVGIVTSPQGAALRDMLRILSHRMPSLRVILSPARVQGNGSAQEIAQALLRLDQTKACDVIIVGRGGGSLEDLWAFNEEVVARAVAQCQTPVVSAVGHETDFSICDFVADLRVATPTHAASTVVCDREEVLGSLKQQIKRLDHAISAHAAQCKLRLMRLKAKLSDPRLVLMSRMQRVDELAMRQTRALQLRIQAAKAQSLAVKKRLDAYSPQARLSALKRQLAAMSRRLWLKHPKAHLLSTKAQLERFKKRLHTRFEQRLAASLERHRILTTQLFSLSPLGVLARGYAVAYASKTGRVLTGPEQVAIGDYVDVQLSQGKLVAQVCELKIEDHEDEQRSCRSTL